MGNTIDVTPLSGSPFGENSLFELRKQFVQMTGRYDLIVNGDLALNKNAGANRFLNMGQRWLDIHARHTKSLEHVYGLLEADEFLLTLDNIMNVEKVFVVDEDEGARFTFDNEDIYTPADFRLAYPELISTWTTGTPEALAIGIAGVSGPVLTTTAACFSTEGLADYDELVFGNSYQKTALLFYPKADADYTVDVIARTYSRKLFYDYDYSFWTTAWPEVLCLASAMCAEKFMKNTTGVRDYMAALEPYLNQLDNTLVEQEMFGKESRMEA